MIEVPLCGGCLDSGELERDAGPLHPDGTPGGVPNIRSGYRGTSLIRKRIPPGPYLRSMPRVLGGS